VTSVVDMLKSLTAGIKQSFLLLLFHIEQVAAPTIDSPIPTGSWVLYHHPMAETKWTLSTFKTVATMSTWREFWSVMETLRSSTLSDSMFFLMLKGIDPLY